LPHRLAVPSDRQRGLATAVAVYALSLSLGAVGAGVSDSLPTREARPADQGLGIGPLPTAGSTGVRDQTDAQLAIRGVTRIFPYSGI
jgi:hypothetical protein